MRKNSGSEADRYGNSVSCPRGADLVDLEALGIVAADLPAERRHGRSVKYSAGPKAVTGSAYPVRPVDGLDPDLANTVKRFADGTGRYEHLDSLWNDNAELNTYNEWSALAAKASVSEEVRRPISIREGMAYAIESELADDGLESTARTVMEDLELPIYQPSTCGAVHRACGGANSACQAPSWEDPVAERVNDRNVTP